MADTVQLNFVKDAPSCYLCGFIFGFFSAKVNCWCCGNLFCSTCTQQQVDFPEKYNYQTPKKVCNQCLPRKLFAEYQVDRAKNGKLVHNLFSLSSGRTLAYTECGDPTGFPTFIIHGMFGIGDASEKHEIAKKNKIRLIAPTLPGFGFSETKLDRKLSEWPSDLLELCTHLGITSEFNLIGISFGCLHAMSVAALHPTRVKKMLLIGPQAPDHQEGFNWYEGMGFGIKAMYSIPYSSPWISSYVDSMSKQPLQKDPVAFIKSNLLDGSNQHEKEQWEKMGKEKQEELLTRMAYLMKDSMTFAMEGMSHLTGKLLHDPPGFSLGDISCEVQIWAFTGDKLSPPEHSQFLHKKIKNSTLKIEEGGHMTVIFKEDIYDNFFQ